MTLAELVAFAKDKTRFRTIGDYSAFCEQYLSFIQDGLQAVIVSQNENHYRFFQYRQDGNFNVTILCIPPNRQSAPRLTHFLQGKAILRGRLTETCLNDISD